MAIRPLSRVRRNICALLLALLILSWGDLIYSFVRDYRTIEQQCENNLQTQVVGFEVHTLQLIQFVNVLLLDIARLFENYPVAELQDICSDWFKRLPELAAVAVIDVETAEVLFCLDAIPLPEDFSVPSRVDSTDNSNVLQISDRLYKGYGGQNLIAVYRRFPEGERSLLVVSMVRADSLLNFHMEIALDPSGSIAIFHHNGLLFARTPQGERLAGRSFADSLLFREILSKSAHGLLRSTTMMDDTRRTVAYRKLTDLPLVITVGTSSEGIFTEWKKRLKTFLLAQIAVSAAIILSFMFLARALSRVESAEIELEERVEHFRQVANSSVDAVISVSRMERVRFWSVGAEQIFLCSEAEALNMPISCFLHLVDKDKPLTLNELTAPEQTWSKQRTLEVQGQRKNGEIFPTEFSVSRGVASGEPLYTLIVRDVTERKQLEERIRRMIRHDNLTGLPNRALLMDRLQVAMAQVHRQGGQLALLFIDLDKFKPVNDTYGHEMGDQLLKQVAKRMLASVRATDTVARIGGDEFAVLLTNVEGEASVSNACEHLLTTIQRVFHVAGSQITIGCSIGVDLYKGQDLTATELIGRADRAMYAAKRAGRNRYRFVE